MTGDSSNLVSVKYLDVLGLYTNKLLHTIETYIENSKDTLAFGAFAF